MRKRMIGSLAVVGVALLFALPLQAQSVYIGGGLTIPTGDFGEFADTGWMTAGGFMIDIGDSGASAGVEGFYSGASESDGDADASIYGAMATLLYRVGNPARVGPYIFGGAGLTAVDLDDPTDGDGSDEDFGYQFGAGLDFPFADRVGAWLEGRYMGSSVFEGTHFFAILAGLGFGLGG